MSAPAVAIPRRRWGNEPCEPAPAPIVLTSSRDRHEVPHVAGATRLARAAEAAGWAVRQRYALADVPKGWPSSRSRAHRLASVVVRLRRRGLIGWAAWHRVDDGPWRLNSAAIETRQYGLRALTAEVIKP